MNSITTIDGRYQDYTNELKEYFSEDSLIRTKVTVECDYLISIVKILKNKDLDTVKNIYKNWNSDSSESIKSIEKITNHDVKAVEYYVCQKLDLMKLNDYKNYVHWGLTSQDINHISSILSLRSCMEDIMYPIMIDIIVGAVNIDQDETPMLSYTHGQVASPTTFRKEMMVYKERLQNQLFKLQSYRWKTKFGGTVGRLQVHKHLLPDIEWENFMNTFLMLYDVERHTYTTQIDHYDYLVEYFDTLKRFNTILIDFSQDMWLYISKGYLKQVAVANEVGSSTMPHKVNPINFENAEGNLGLSNCMLEHFSRKLPISRLQRDLTDSTVSRNYGTALGYAIISYKNILKGIKRVTLDKHAMSYDLNQNWSVLAEPIQYAMKLSNIPKSYEILKGLTRNKEISKDEIRDFIIKQDLDQSLKHKLLSLTPESYV